MSDICECGSYDSEIRRKVIKGGSIQFKSQCVNCGATRSNPYSKSEVINTCGTLNVPEYDDGLREDYASRIRHEHEQAMADKKAEFFVWYNEYLKSPEWRSRRARVLKRASGLCEGCLVSEATQVHHLTYEHVGDELMFELVAICDACHEKAHSKEVKF